MEILAWVWWLATTALGIALSLVWFLIGGWVSTLAQIGVVVLVIFGYKYGWRRAPAEIAGRARGLGGAAWSWVRRREQSEIRRNETIRERIVTRVVRQRRLGDINLSSLLNVMMLTGILALCLAGAR